LTEEERKELAAAIADVKGMVTEAAAEGRREKTGKELKDSTGYKRLLGTADRNYKQLKQSLLPNCRKRWRGELEKWMAAAVILEEGGGVVWPSLLGTGGNDGNLDFTNNFMQRIGDLLEVETEAGGPRECARGLLAEALWGEPAIGLKDAAAGQYQPGAAGGANSSTGAQGESLVNPWDFVLMMEGLVLFRGRGTRRLDPAAMAKAAAPFAVRSHAVGYGTAGDEAAERGEQWMPVWGRPAKFREVEGLMGEGRVQLGRQVAHRPVDVARAISRLGVARGVVSFCRYGYLERNGQSNLAVPLGRMGVREAARGRLVDDLAPWMDKLQRVARGKNAPARLVQAERRLGDAVLAALMHDGESERWRAVLLAAVEVERVQAGGSGFEAGPIPELSPEWIEAAGEGVEVRLAAALGSAAAGFRREGGIVDPVRHHWLPLERGARRFKIQDKRLAKDPRVVMGGRDAVGDCAAVVERRLMESSQGGKRSLPLVAAAGYEASLGDLALLLGGGVNLERVLDLARALMAVNWTRWANGKRVRRGGDGMPPEGWLAVRLACLPWALPPDRLIPAEAGMVRRLASGDGPGAMALAIGRLRAAGIRPPLRAGGLDRSAARLWAASLVFPIDRSGALRAAAALDPTLKGM
jgi:CRISPR-associated protein Csx17